MRERKTFAQRTRTRSSQEAKRKYFLVYEGSETEIQYFDAVAANKEEIGISPLVTLVPILRSYSEEGWSNPAKILERVIGNLDEKEKAYISYETLLNRIMDYMYEEKILSSSRAQGNAVWKMLVWICQEKLEKSLAYDVEDLEEDCRAVIRLLNEKAGIVPISEDIMEYIRSDGITYDPNFDKICLIIDRDRASFSLNQYEYVWKKCREKGFGFYVTNPCFEFWLLLHFDEVLKIDKDTLLENPKVTAKRRFTEQELRKLLPGYTKGKYHAEILATRDRILKAIQNEKSFSENADELREKIGSRIGIMLGEILEEET